MGTQSNDGIPPSARSTIKDIRSASAASFTTARSVARSNLQGQGSFNTEVRSASTRPDALPRYEYGGYNGAEDDRSVSERKQAEYRERIDKEIKIKVGTENLLEALNAKKEKNIKDQKKVVESELHASNRKLAQLRTDLDAEIQKGKEQREDNPRGRLSQIFKNAPLRSVSHQEDNEDGGDGDGEDNGTTEAESPSYVLAEILQALEAGDMPSDYYVNHANELVELFKRHPTLKYDLAWSIFGLRMQMMLLSDSREVVAAAYRVVRYAITDRRSLQKIRSLQTDILVILSLVKESKARVEREQALKFVRAFTNVKDGTEELHSAVVRVVVAVANQADDQLRNIAVLTLAEMLLKDSDLVANAGGISVLAEAMGSGSYSAPETLVVPFLHLMDMPAKRGILSSGFEFSAAFATLTAPLSTFSFEERLRSSSRVIAAMFKSWTGLMTLAINNFLPVRSVISALYICNVPVRTAVTDLIADILRIHFPSWAGSFIGGRRLTTYGRVNLRPNEGLHHVGQKLDQDDDMRDRNLTEHFTAVALAIFLKQGLLPALMQAETNTPSPQLGKKVAVLIAEVLRMAADLLPNTWSADIQVLPNLFATAVDFEAETRLQAASTVYEVDRINRMMYRSRSTQVSQLQTGVEETVSRARAGSKAQTEQAMDEAQLRARMNESNVLSTVNFDTWKWSVIQSLLDGPLQNPRRVAELISTTKFAHRLLGFLRPFKWRFSDAPNTKPNQRYVRAGCSLLRALLQTNEGTRYLADNKLIPQIAECLAQKDWASGITSSAPLFSPDRLVETMVGGYFAFLGVLCSDPRGLMILERWRIINMFYHIIELKDRDDLIRSLLTQLDYSLDSHPRIILGKAMISGTKEIRILATRLLRRYALMPVSDTYVAGPAEWAIKLLVGQLYDPEIEVCEVAIKTLEEACNNLSSLEYVVKCRPALDHLGEIGAPLLLRFLSTSVGYHYLDGLDYITKEMDDWFLGGNDTYVTLVEASLARALADIPERPQSSLDDPAGETRAIGLVPPHFYRELTRTAEGCELLESKGHFEEFAMTIEERAMEHEDAESILKLKGCLWAVGNIGSMELGAPFLERSDVVKHIVEIAETSLVLTLRGTAFYVLGLISRSLYGQEILAEHGWDGTTNVLGESLGYSLPVDLNKLFLRLTPSQNGASDVTMSQLTQTRSITDAEPVNQEILSSITKLCNSVLLNKAVGELNNLKHKRMAPGFASTYLFKKAMLLMATRTYHIAQYRFVIDLFDKNVLRKIVLEEEDSDDGPEDHDDVNVDGRLRGDSGASSSARR